MLIADDERSALFRNTYTRVVVDVYSVSYYNKKKV